jgi:hypothetical protein
VQLRGHIRSRNEYQRMVFQKMGLMRVLVFSGARTLGQNLTGFATLPEAN